jgi:hypothetical protein
MGSKAKSGKPMTEKGVRPQHVDHNTLLAPMSVQAEGQDLPFLGHARAIVTVCHCASTAPANLAHTLNELGVNGLAFQQCVFGTVTSLGYSVAVDDIPDGPDDTLMSVVDAITNAPKA